MADMDAILARLDRLAIAIEQLVQCQSRKLAQSEHDALRAAQKCGPTTDDARKAVEAKMRKKGLL